MKERLHYVDVCKGLLILMVIWQHIPAFVSWAGVDSSVIESWGDCLKTITAKMSPNISYC